MADKKPVAGRSLGGLIPATGDLPAVQRVQVRSDAYHGQQITIGYD